MGAAAPSRERQERIAQGVSPRHSREDLDAVVARTAVVKARVVLAIAIAAAFVAGCGGDDAPRSDGESSADPPVPASAEQVLSRDPYMGVSCRTPNTFACDRVGLAVWLREPAVGVEAAIAGRAFELDDPEWSGPVDDGGRRLFAGFLQPAGLIDGPLQVTADAGPDRWIGRQAISATVDLRIVRDGGTTTTTSVEVQLSPGWG
jgi:hypothetical protein